jgi:hypothetical protein
MYMYMYAHIKPALIRTVDGRYTRPPVCPGNPPRPAPSLIFFFFFSLFVVWLFFLGGCGKECKAEDVCSLVVFFFFFFVEIGWWPGFRQCGSAVSASKTSER